MTGSLASHYTLRIMGIFNVVKSVVTLVIRELWVSLKSGFAEIGPQLALLAFVVAVVAVAWVTVVPFAQSWVLPQFGIYPELDETRGHGTVRIPALELEADWGLEHLHARPLDDRRGVRIVGYPLHPASPPWMELWLTDDDAEPADFETSKKTPHGGLLHFDTGTETTERGRVGRLTGVLELGPSTYRVRCGDQHRRGSLAEASGRSCLPWVAALKPISPSDEKFPVCVDRRMDDIMAPAEPRGLPDSMTCQVSSSGPTPITP